MGEAMSAPLTVHAAMLSAGCTEDCGTVTMMWWEPETLQHVIQHGDNPEAVLLTDEAWLRVSSPESYFERFREWARRVHDYESGG